MLCTDGVQPRGDKRDMRLKIGLFNESFPPTIDGVSNTVFNYAWYLQKNHCDCTVVTPKYPHVTDDYPFRVYRYPSFDISRRLGYRVGNVLSVKMLRDLRAEQFDLIHIHSPFASSVIASELQRFSHKVPVVLTYHTKFDIDIAKRVKSGAIRKVAMKFLKHNIHVASEIWSVTEAAAESMRNVGYHGDYIVMENGTDFPKGSAPEQSVERIRTMYNLQHCGLTFLFVGRMMWYKNTRLIFDALQLLKPELAFKLVLVGDGADRAAMEQYVRQIGLADRVEFAGAVNDREQVRAFFSAADLFLFPSTYDTSGLVVKEAAACALPSVLVQGSCAAEGVTDGVSGFLCAENAAALAKTIRQAVADRQKLQMVGHAAQQTVYLSWEDAVAKAYDRYEYLVRNWQKPLPYQKRSMNP